jgi:hypothetical protein
MTRLTRFLDRWIPWAATEFLVIAGYVKGTKDYALLLINRGDGFEDLYVVVYCDTNHASPRSTTGYAVALEGAAGSNYLQVWSSKMQTPVTTSSGESECVGWGSACKTAIKLASLVEQTRRRPAKIFGFVDNESLRCAILRGSSAKMNHLRRSAELNFLLLQQTLVLPKHVPGKENFADLLTKILTRQQLQYLLARVFGLAKLRSGQTMKIKHDDPVSEWEKVVAAAVMTKHGASCEYAGQVSYGVGANDSDAGTGSCCIWEAFQQKKEQTMEALMALSDSDWTPELVCWTDADHPGTAQYTTGYVLTEEGAEPNQPPRVVAQGSTVRRRRTRSTTKGEFRDV